MDSHTLEVIEFDRVRQLLAEHANCALGRHMARKLKPVSRADLVATWLGQVEELIEVSSRIGLPPFGGVHDIRAEVRSAIPPHSLEPEQFALLADTFAATHEILLWAEKLPENAPRLKTLCERIGDFKALATSIRNVVDARGKIRDDASAKLRRIRQEIASAQIRISQVIDRMLRDPHVTRWLRYPQATFHQDRLVLPLSAEHRGRIPGIIHRSSDSGATLFVEPAPAVELNNRIITLKNDESSEINRLLWHLTHQVHLNRDEILKTLDALAVLDLVVAKVRFARTYRLTCPRLSEDHQLHLRQARHLLLVEWYRQRTDPAERKEVVPIDIRLKDDFDVLIITGPNTGGKTVTLKTTALIAAMAQAGLPVPAAPGSRVPIYRDILVDIGDEQSLQQSLSTFSAHLKRLLVILKRARADTLVLIDELGAGTDPEEGSAIGQAVVQELLERRSPALITTHLGALKTLAYSTRRAENACVDFDVQTLQPTYRLRIGEPGNSNAINIATRLGLPPRLVSTARRLLGESHRQLTRAIRGTLASRRQAEAARAEADAARAEAEQARKKAEQERAALAEQRRQFQQWVEAISSLRPGQKVHVRRFDRDGIVVRVLLHKQLAVVDIGTLQAEVPLKEIVPI